VVKLSDEDIAEIKCLRVVAMATNIGTKIAINWLYERQRLAIGLDEGLSGRPIERRYCRYPASKGCCYGNHFLAFDGLQVRLYDS